MSLTAKVEKILCKRIALARKTMKCIRALTIRQALDEVWHLQHLRHHHIVQLDVTYLQGREFAVLVYPVANCHLGQFLRDTADAVLNDGFFCRAMFLETAITCPISALCYVHEHNTKHMDVKLHNILVKAVYSRLWKVYLPDFGISRSFAEEDHSQTGGPTSYTPRYCAPEVRAGTDRGRAADIFSLGVVFLEMLTVWSRKDLDAFAEWCCGGGEDESFSANLDRVHSWRYHIQDLRHSVRLGERAPPKHVLSAVGRILQSDPETRPPAKMLLDIFSSSDIPYDFRTHPKCCDRGPTPYMRYYEGQ